MRIANPIYDVVFKHLMEDDEIARGLIGRLLGVKVVSLQVLPQEVTRSGAGPSTQQLPRRAATVGSEVASVKVFRLDFVAEIELSDGTRLKVLIELQKASSPEVMGRFRNYLSRHYAVPPPPSTSTEAGEAGQAPPAPVVLPIIAIYILGFKLGEDIPKVVRVERRYLNAVTGQGLPSGVKDEFLEKLTHDAVAVQVPHIDEHAGTDLERALLVFNQHWAAQDSLHYLEVEEDFDGAGEDKLVQRMTRKLLMAASDEETRQQMELEDEVTRTMQREQDAQRRAEEAERREAQERRLKEEERRLKEEECRLKEEAERREAEECRLKEEERRLKEEAERREAEECRLKEEALARLAEMDKELRKLKGSG